MKSSILTTLVPSAGFDVKTAAWYSRSRPCVHCKAEVMRRRETEAGPVIDVRHHPRCDALGAER